MAIVLVWAPIGDHMHTGPLGLNLEIELLSHWLYMLGHWIVGFPGGSAIPGILQARTLEWVAISFSNA